MTEKATWLLAFLALYWALCLFWARATARLARSPKSYFLADRNLPAWVVVTAATAFAFSGWMFLGYPDLVFRDGFPFAETCLGAIAIALGSAFFLKRQWMLGKRYGYVTAGEMVGHYFAGGEVIRLAMVLIALTFAVAFAAMQISAAGAILAALSDGLLGRYVAMWVLTAVAFAYVAFGGMRAAAYVGTLQGVLMAAGVAVLGAYAYWVAGGFDAAMQGFGSLSLVATHADGVAPAPVATASLFEIPGVVQFTRGLGKEAPVGGLWTAAMIFSYSLALMGLTLNPIFSVLAFSSRSPKGFAAQATWASAGVMGGILLLFTVVQGLGADLLAQTRPMPGGLASTTALGPAVPRIAGVVGGYLARLGVDAPWFAAIVAVAGVASVQALVAISASATSTIVVRDVFRRYLDPDLDTERQRAYARVGVGLILLAALMLATFAPSVAIALGALALGFGLQLLPVLTANCWIPWITRPAATMGLVTGMVFVLFTEDLGIQTARFLGLELPWGRWPWTIHSGLWGLAINIVIILVISLISQRGEEKTGRQRFHDFLRSHTAPIRPHQLRYVAWAAALAWFFFAIGPGAVIGNSAFGDPKGGFSTWSLGVPPLWGWQLVWWLLGVVLVWFLSHRMGMATMPSKFIELATKADRTQTPAPWSGNNVAIAAFWVVLLAISIATLLRWSFGR